MVRTNLKLAYGAMTAVPEKVADELAESFAARAKLVQLAVVVPGLGVTLLTLLVVWLDWQRRQTEHAGLRRLGASQRTLVSSFVLELLGTAVISVMLASGLTVALSIFAARWVM